MRPDSGLVVAEKEEEEEEEKEEEEVVVVVWWRVLGVPMKLGDVLYNTF